MRPRPNVDTIPPRIRQRRIRGHVRRELGWSLLHETLDPLTVVRPAEQRPDDLGVEEVGGFRCARVAVHELAHQVGGDDAGVLGDFFGELDGAGKDLLGRGEGLGEEVVEQVVVGGVDCAGCGEVEGFACSILWLQGAEGGRGWRVVSFHGFCLIHEMCVCGWNEEGTQLTR